MPDTMLTTEAQSPFRNRSPEIKDLAAALVKAQAELSGAKKGAKAVITGSQTRTYADLASVWEAIREPLTDNGLCIVQFPRTAGQGVEIETTLMHGATGQFMSDVLWVPCGKNDAQGLGSAITYGRRYALMAVVGVCPVDDDGAAAVASHKPGAAGSAGGGDSFRPANGPRQGSASGHRMAMEEPELVANAAGRAKGTMPNAEHAKKVSADEKAKKWTDKAVETLNLSGQSVDSLSKFLSENNDKIEWLEANAPEQHERFFTAYNNAAEAARAQVAA